MSDPETWKAQQTHLENLRAYLDAAVKNGLIKRYWALRITDDGKEIAYSFEPVIPLKVVQLNVDLKEEPEGCHCGQRWCSYCQ